MKKYLFLVAIFFSYFCNTTFASQQFEHFVRKDGTHICSTFHYGDYKPCEEFGIIYDTIGKVISGEEPFFTTNLDLGHNQMGGIVRIGDDYLCVFDGKETENENCQISYLTRLSGEKWCFILPGHAEKIYEQCSSLQDFGIIDTASGLVSADNFTLYEMKGPSEIPIGSGEIIKYQNGKEVLSFTETQGGNWGEATCIVNGKKIDCAEMAEGVKSVAKIGLWIFLGFGLLFLIGGVFWLFMLMHAIMNPIPNKILWIAAIFFVSLVGAIIYYFVIKRRYTSVMVPNENTQPYQMNGGLTYHESPVQQTGVNPPQPSPQTMNPQAVDPLISTPVQSPQTNIPPISNPPPHNPLL